jgi:uncharacterized protein (DUF1330 family)
MIVLGHFTDFERFMSGYQRVVGPMVERFGGRYVLMGSGAQVLEGSGPGDGDGGAVISEWPDRATALRFWTSPEYAAAKKLRAGTGRFQVVLVDAPGVDTGHGEQDEGATAASRRGQ